ncbi:hypothetical protein CTA1_9084 [Colletotrichum tanaceti]|uniref:Uncharacterized protein n=1 Tax=Colletotrichum tanaceti TaxID=1306861 RepID=A0A4U6XN59_9PEZI|nr:hypothetical protein CTA1_9084 [Colletotrichum tanaceti]
MARWSALLLVLVDEDMRTWRDEEDALQWFSGFAAVSVPGPKLLFSPPNLTEVGWHVPPRVLSSGA